MYNELIVPEGMFVIKNKKDSKTTVISYFTEVKYEFLVIKY